MTTQVLERRGLDGRTTALAAIAVAVAVCYAVAMMLPYLVNDLDRFTLEEVSSGSHDPKDLWPIDTVFAWPVGVARLLALTLAPLGLIVVLLGASAQLATTWRSSTWVRRAVLGIALLVVGGVLAWLVSPLGAALMAWTLD